METRDLFHQDDIKSNPAILLSNMPLAARMRPRNLQEFFGQSHILDSGQLLQRLITSDTFSSLIFYGPPGTGKTTLATIIAHETHRRFVALSAVTSNVAEVRRAIEDARDYLARSEKTILFVDEIHRFNKAQQDILLPHIEQGTISFIGATTQNPYFSIVSPLISRSQVFRFKSLSPDEILKIIKNALSDKERGFGLQTIKENEEGLMKLSSLCEGDARRALNALDAAVRTIQPDSHGVHHLTKEILLQSLQERAPVYDWDEDQHYDTISAFIKSVRGSDPDAALYWLAKMMEGGEDILFIARRLMILASEDIGNADPHALMLATSCLACIQMIGLPEARIPLAQTTIYLACAPKSNASYTAIEKALEAVRNERVQEVPAHLKNVKGPDEKDEHYQYPHNHEGHFVEQAYVNKTTHFLELSSSGLELKMAERLKAMRKTLAGSKEGL